MLKIRYKTILFIVITGIAITLPNIFGVNDTRNSWYILGFLAGMEVWLWFHILEIGEKKDGSKTKS